jgi:hypothetical protein
MCVTATTVVLYLPETFIPCNRATGWQLWFSNLKQSIMQFLNRVAQPGLGVFTRRAFGYQTQILHLEPRRQALFFSRDKRTDGRPKKECQSASVPRVGRTIVRLAKA